LYVCELLVDLDHELIQEVDTNILITLLGLTVDLCFNEFFYLNNVLMFEHAIHSDYDSIITC